jgi:hypothetical protein
LFLLTVSLGLQTGVNPAAAQLVEFPAASGLIDVTKPPYMAKGDGVTDNTAALKKAIADNSPGKSRTLYFPKGIYVVSDQLKWYNDFALQGAGAEYTVIKLKDGAPGYESVSQQKAVIYAGDNNTSFGNSIFDLTVDTGTNPGAVGIDYVASNQGAIENVVVQGIGPIGIDMQRPYPGPLLIKNVKVVGFNYGIAVGQRQYSVTLEHITLKNQKVAGLLNNRNQIWVRDLKSVNAVPAIRDISSDGLVVVIDGNFTGGSSSVSAIDTAGFVYLRNIQTAGYQSALKLAGKLQAGTSIAEFVSRPALSVFPSPARSLHLPIEETPTFHDPDMANWANVRDYASIQAAIDSGKSTVYFPFGTYPIAATINVRGNVKRIVGNMAELVPVKGGFAGPVFRFENSNDVVVDRFRIGKNDSDNSVFSLIFEHVSPKAVALRHLRGHASYKGIQGAGSLYVEDVCCRRFEINGQKMWARQLNIETIPGSETRLINNGGTAWVLGYKTEGNQAVLKTTGGGKTELLGGIFKGYYSPSPPDLPLIVNDESKHSLVYEENPSWFGVNILETRGGVSKTFANTGGYWPGTYYHIVPLYTGYQHAEMEATIIKITTPVATTSNKTAPGPTVSLSPRTISSSPASTTITITRNAKALEPAGTSTPTTPNAGGTSTSTTEIAASAPGNMSTYNQSVSPDQIQYADVNGDGLADALNFDISGGSGVWVSLSTGTGFTSPQMWLKHGESTPDQIQYADVNGDGKADALYFDTSRSGGVWVSLSTGTSFTSPQMWLKHGESTPDQIQYADVNGDGKADALYFDTSGGVWVSLSTGSGFRPPKMWLKHEE